MMEAKPVSNALPLAEIQSKYQLLEESPGQGFGQSLPRSCKHAMSARPRAPQSPYHCTPLMCATSISSYLISMAWSYIIRVTCLGMSCARAHLCLCA